MYSKKRYEQKVQEQKSIQEERNVLLENEAVKKYLVLIVKKDILNMERDFWYSEMKYDEYASCKHILINLTDAFGRKFCKGCIKCGLDERVVYADFGLYDLTEEQEVMYRYLKEHLLCGNFSALSSDICDLDLARAIYKKIKEAHPDIDDVTARKYFEIALNNIRNIEVSEERKKSRAKRLSLTPDFNKWNN